MQSSSATVTVYQVMETRGPSVFSDSPRLRRSKLARSHHSGAFARASLGRFHTNHGYRADAVPARVLRVPAMHKDGRTLSIAFTVGLLLGAPTNVTGLVAVIRDEPRASPKSEICASD